MDRAAYRIVQEALTNVRKHAAPGSAVEVVIEYADGGVRVRVRNAGAPPHPHGPTAQPAGDTDGGSGIAGMRARAESLGGTLEAAPMPGGGFQVAAFLPAPVKENA